MTHRVHALVRAIVLLLLLVHVQHIRPLQHLSVLLTLLLLLSKATVPWRDGHAPRSSGRDRTVKARVKVASGHGRGKVRDGRNVVGIVTRSNGGGNVLTTLARDSAIGRCWSSRRTSDRLDRDLTTRDVRIGFEMLIIWRRMEGGVVGHGGRAVLCLLQQDQLVSDSDTDRREEDEPGRLRSISVPARADRARPPSRAV